VAVVIIGWEGREPARGFLAAVKTGRYHTNV
jgi:hypothetical protein